MHIASCIVTNYCLGSYTSEDLLYFDFINSVEAGNGGPIGDHITIYSCKYGTKLPSLTYLLCCLLAHRISYSEEPSLVAPVAELSHAHTLIYR